MDNGPGSGATGIRNGPNVASGDCACWDRGFDYVGFDLPIGRNPRPEKSAQECQKSCQSTQGCTHWTYRTRGNGRRGQREGNCWRKSSGRDRRANRNRISGEARCGAQQPSSPSQNRLVQCPFLLTPSFPAPRPAAAPSAAGTSVLRASSPSPTRTSPTPAVSLWTRTTGSPGAPHSRTVTASMSGVRASGATAPPPAPWTVPGSPPVPPRPPPSRWRAPSHSSTMSRTSCPGSPRWVGHHGPV